MSLRSQSYGIAGGGDFRPNPVARRSCSSQKLHALDKSCTVQSVERVTSEHTAMSTGNISGANSERGRKLLPLRYNSRSGLPVTEIIKAVLVTSVIVAGALYIVAEQLK